MKHKPDFEQMSTRGLKRDSRAQLLLVTGVLLTFSLLIVASVTQRLLIVETDIEQPSNDLVFEFQNVKTVFGEGIEQKANHYAAQYSQKQSVQLAFNDVYDQMQILVASYELILDASLVSYGAVEDADPSVSGDTFQVVIDLLLVGAEVNIYEQVEYLVHFPT